MTLSIDKILVYTARLGCHNSHGICETEMNVTGKKPENIEQLVGHIGVWLALREADLSCVKLAKLLKGDYL